MGRSSRGGTWATYDLDVANVARYHVGMGHIRYRRNVARILGLAALGLFIISLMAGPSNLGMYAEFGLVVTGCIVGVLTFEDW